MLRKLTERMHNEEKGFTLIELLVVMLIIGILAAIALPVFLGQQKKGQDADAKSNARNMVSHVESCYAETQDYQQCDTTAAINPSGLNFTAGATEATLGTEAVSITSADADSYVVFAKSRADTGGTNHLFRITKTDGGNPARTCDVDNNGGCPADGTW